MLLPAAPGEIRQGGNAQCAERAPEPEPASGNLDRGLDVANVTRRRVRCRLAGGGGRSRDNYGRRVRVHGPSSSMTTASLPRLKEPSQRGGVRLVGAQLN